MKQVITKHFPWGGFKAMAVWPFIFIRGDKDFTESDLRHEEIHGEQQKEMAPIAVALVAVMAIVGCGWWSLLAIPLYYYMYGVCWLIELVRCAKDKERGQINVAGYKRRNYIHRVEHSIIFEREAYAMQGDEWYLGRRTFWAWVHF